MANWLGGTWRTEKRYHGDLTKSAVRGQFACGQAGYGVIIAVGDVLSLTAFFYGDEKATSLPNTSYLACFAYRQNRRLTVDLFQPLRAYFPVRPGKLLSRYFFYGK